MVDADGTILGKYRKHHIPHLDRFWEKFYFRPGNLGYPVFDTAVGKVGVYICYDRHFPEGWRELGLNGAQIVFNPNATKPGLSNRLWEVEQPAAAVANGYFVLQPNRVGREDNEYGDLAVDFYGTSQVIDPRGNFVGERGSGDDEEIAHPRPRPGHDPADARRLAVLPRPPARLLHAIDRRSREPDERADITMSNRHSSPVAPSSRRPAAPQADVLIDGETIVAVLAPGLDAARAPTSRHPSTPSSTRPAST